MRRRLNKDVRLFVIERDNYTCQYCGKKGIPVIRFGYPAVIEVIRPDNILTPITDYSIWNGDSVLAFHFDHVIPHHFGGSDDVENIRLSCRHCNESKRHSILEVDNG